MRRRRYNRHNDNEYHNNDILLTEFRFFNKSKKVIDDKILLDIQKKLLESETNFIYWTSDEFSKYGVGFRLKKQLYDKDGKTLLVPNVYIKILEFENITFTTEEFNNCQYILDKKIFINYILTDEQKELLDEFSYSNLNDEKNIFPKIITFDNWENTISFLIEKKIINTYSCYNYEWKEYTEDIKILLGIEKLEKPYYKIHRNGYSSDKVKHIFKVIEKRINNKNYRIELYTRVTTSEQWYIRITAEDDKEYTLIDEDRIYFQSYENNIYYYVDISSNQKIEETETIEVEETIEIKEIVNNKEVIRQKNVRKNKDIKRNRLIINHEIFNSMSRNIHEILSDGQISINPMIYNFYSERAIKFDDHDTIVDTRQQMINNRYKEIIEEGKIIKIDKINIGKNIIYIEDERFKIEFPIGFINVKENFNKIRDSFRVGDARFNFNLLYENLLKISKLRIINMNHTQYAEYKDFKKITFTINEMEITISKEDTRIKINEIFCRIADVYPILTKLICYNDVEEFNKFVKDVSHIGYEWKRMINTGVIIELSNPFYNIFKQTGNTQLEKTILRFSLLWDAEKRSNVALLLNGEKYPIKYKGKFKRFFDYPKRAITITKLTQELNECIENLDDDKILEIIDNAIEEGKIIKKRGEELVSNTIKDISAKEVEINIRGQKMLGYTFNGKISKAEYFINKIDLSVHKMINGTWDRRCIVDDHNKNRIFEDRLANRLANIYNEPDKLKRFLMVN